MRYLPFLAIAVFFSTSALVSMRRDWFWFVYNMPGGDKCAHFIGAGLLAFCMVLGFSSLSALDRPYSLVVSVVFAVLLVSLDEVIQIVIPSRAFELHDLAWSLSGVLIFGLAAAGIERLLYLSRSK